VHFEASHEAVLEVFKFVVLVNDVMTTFTTKIHPINLLATSKLVAPLAHLTVNTGLTKSGFPKRTYDIAADDALFTLDAAHVDNGSPSLKWYQKWYQLKN
jgi:hypothetical protein